ncbi:MAG: hypothetical protein IJ639_04285, partial [Ruminococcus sp.]|nr:hypothetical protein [Ruminococcus sp.]
MKKLFSVLLVIALIVTAIPLTFAAAQGDTDGVYVVADGVTYKVSQGDTVTYVYYLNIGEKMSAISGVLSYDTDGLSLNIPLDEDDESDVTGVFPIIGGNVVVNNHDPSKLNYNFSLPTGRAFIKDTAALIRAEFTITASSGTYRIDNAITTLSGVSETVYIKEGEVITAPSKMQGGLDGLSPYDPDATEQPTEKPTEKATEKATSPATEKPTTDPSVSGDVVVIADGVRYAAKTGDVFDYVYYLNNGERVCSIEGDFYYSADGLELIIPENEDDLTNEMIFPKLKNSVMVNEPESGHLKYNYSNAKGTKFDKDTAELIRAQFKVTATSGELNITNAVHTLAGENEKKYLYRDEVVEPLQSSGSDVPDLTPLDEKPTEKATETVTEKSTEKPTSSATEAQTAPPTQAATSASAVFVIADGVTYKVRQGETFEYVYNFS